MFDGNRITKLYRQHSSPVSIYIPRICHATHSLNIISESIIVAPFVQISHFNINFHFRRVSCFVSRVSTVLLAEYIVDGTDSHHMINIRTVILFGGVWKL